MAIDQAQIQNRRSRYGEKHRARTLAPAHSAVQFKTLSSAQQAVVLALMDAQAAANAAAREGPRE